MSKPLGDPPALQTARPPLDDRLGGWARHVARSRGEAEASKVRVQILYTIFGEALLSVLRSRVRFSQLRLP